MKGNANIAEGEIQRKKLIETESDFHIVQIFAHFFNSKSTTASFFKFLKCTLTYLVYLWRYWRYVSIRLIAFHLLIIITACGKMKVYGTLEFISNVPYYGIFTIKPGGVRLFAYFLCFMLGDCSNID